ncbi:MAG: DUF1566 domain-containing protein [Desulfobacterales bacterium]|nr:DUF1566 domain-containing protein [Desulfobacterales bacterium]
MNIIKISAVILLSFFITVAFAGNIDSPALPADSGSAMFTIDDIYNRLDSGTAGSKRTGSFNEAGSLPASTGHTLNEIMNKAPALDNSNGASTSDVKTGKTFWGLTNGQWGLKTGTGNISSANLSPVEKTGQATSYGTRDDGVLKKGVAWASPRFTDNGNGTVTDNNTGLIWLKDANCFSAKTWTLALSSCNNLASGSCGLTDSSVAGDWRMPNVNELSTLIDYGRYNPALPSEHPFTGVQSHLYWSSSTNASSTNYAWDIYLSDGYVYNDNKTYAYYVWPVRGGQ